jgi:hypothetical protein
MARANDISKSSLQVDGYEMINTTRFQVK